MLREVTIKRAIELYEAGQAVCCIIPGIDDPKTWSDYSLVDLTDYLSGVLFLANDEPAPAPEKKKKAEGRGRCRQALRTGGRKLVRGQDRR